MGLIFYSSSRSVAKVTQICWPDFVVKKLAHIAEYATLSLLLYRGFMASGFKSGKAGVYAIVLSIIYAISDELHQSFTPGREPRVRDIIFDTIGAGLAIYCFRKFLPKAPKKIKFWAKKLQLQV